MLHPTGAGDVREALAAVGGIELLCPETEEAIVAALATSPVLVMPQSAWRDDYLVPGLRWIQSESAGYERFPLPLLAARGVVLTMGQGLHELVAEHAIALLLALLRELPDAVRDMGSRRWSPQVAPELAGRTVVIAGLGTIGEGIARRLAGWDARLIGVTRSPARYRGRLTDVRPIAELASACADASVLIVALPAASETLRLVSAKVLDALGRGWLVNVSRGALVDEAALVDRLDDGRIAGAGLDVFETEPLPAWSPLWTLPNVIVTPHRAGRGTGSGERLARLLASNLDALAGRSAWRNRIS